MSSFSPSVPSLDLFSPAKTQNDISSCYFVKKGPSSAINESTDLEFVFEQVLPFIFCNFICVFLFPLVEMHIYIYIYILFCVQSSEHYTNLSESYLELELQLIKEDGTNVVHREPARDDTIPEGADFKVVPINNISHSLFSSVDFTANDTVICSESNYAYKAYFQHLFSYSKEIKKSWCVYHPFIFAKIATVLFYARRKTF